MSHQEQCPRNGRMTTVHADLRNTVYRFREEMLRAEANVPKNPVFESGPASESMMRFFETKTLSQMYSRATQMFALVTIEAFLNEYGYLRFGPDHFEKRFGRMNPITRKLTEMLGEVFSTPIGLSSEIAQVVHSLAERRNALVHPRPELATWADDGTPATATTRRVAATDVRSAEAAVQEMERFFAFFKAIDQHAAFLLRA
jgi:hypothetical protein